MGVGGNTGASLALAKLCPYRGSMGIQSLLAPYQTTQIGATENSKSLSGAP